jgi:hypothetical protein
MCSERTYSNRSRVVKRRAAVTVLTASGYTVLRSSRSQAGYAARGKIVHFARLWGSVGLTVADCRPGVVKTGRRLASAQRVRPFKLRVNAPGTRAPWVTDAQKEVGDVHRYRTSVRGCGFTWWLAAVSPLPPQGVHVGKRPLRGMWVARPGLGGIGSVQLVSRSGEPWHDAILARRSRHMGREAETPSHMANPHRTVGTPLSRSDSDADRGHRALRAG